MWPGPWQSCDIETKDRRGPKDPNGHQALSLLSPLLSMPCLEGLLQALAQSLYIQTSQLTPTELSKAVWAFAKFHHADSHLFQVMAEAVTSTAPQFQAQGLANTIWAFATAEVRNSKLQLTLAESSRVCISGFMPQGLANTVWAFAKLRLHADHALYTDMAEATKSKLGQFSPQNISNTLWAFAKATCYEPDLFLAAADSIVDGPREYREYSVQAAVNCIWAMAETSHHDQRLLHCFTGYALERIDDFKPQDLSNTVWSYAQLKHEDPKLLLAVTTAVKGQVKALTPQHLVCTTWGYALMFEQRPMTSFARVSEDGQLKDEAASRETRAHAKSEWKGIVVDTRIFLENNKNNPSLMPVMPVVQIVSAGGW